MVNRSLFEKFEVLTYARTHERTDRHSSNALEFRADQMSSRNLGSLINISRCYTSIDKTYMPSMRRAQQVVKRLKRPILRLSHPATNPS